MQSKAQLLAQVNADFAVLPAVANACTAVFGYLVSEHAFEEQWLSFGMLKRLSNLPDSALLIQVIQYFTGDRARLLDIKYELVDDEAIYPLDVDYVREYLEEKKLHHPESGELVEDAASKVILTFAPSDFARHLAAQND